MGAKTKQSSFQSRRACQHLTELSPIFESKHSLVVCVRLLTASNQLQTFLEGLILTLLKSRIVIVKSPLESCWSSLLAVYLLFMALEYGPWKFKVTFFCRLKRQNWIDQQNDLIMIFIPFTTMKKFCK